MLELPEDSEHVEVTQKDQFCPLVSLSWVLMAFLPCCPESQDGRDLSSGPAHTPPEIIKLLTPNHTLTQTE